MASCSFVFSDRILRQLWCDNHDLIHQIIQIKAPELVPANVQWVYKLTFWPEIPLCKNVVKTVEWNSPGIKQGMGFSGRRVTPQLSKSNMAGGTYFWSPLGQNFLKFWQMLLGGYLVQVVRNVLPDLLRISWISILIHTLDFWDSIDCKISVREVLLFKMPASLLAYWFYSRLFSM